MVTVMEDLRVILIGGTSHVGKSTVAREVAERLGIEHISTDSLARHPGRPWRTSGQELRPHVAEHYEQLTVDELIASVLRHYARLWPQIEGLIVDRATSSAGTGLVLEGSALWPERIAELTVPNTAAVWLTADASLLRRRIRAAAGYDESTDAEQRLIDRFLARTDRYQDLVIGAVDELGLAGIVNVEEARSVEDLAGAVLRTVTEHRLLPKVELERH